MKNLYSSTNQKCLLHNTNTRALTTLCHVSVVCRTKSKTSKKCPCMQATWFPRPVCCALIPF